VNSTSNSPPAISSTQAMQRFLDFAATQH
jgi:hypothetical protein